jgi:hypothetical protein
MPKKNSTDRKLTAQLVYDHVQSIRKTTAILKVSKSSVQRWITAFLKKTPVVAGIKNRETKLSSIFAKRQGFMDWQKCFKFESHVFKVTELRNYINQGREMTRLVLVVSRTIGHTDMQNKESHCLFGRKNQE